MLEIPDIFLGEQSMLGLNLCMKKKMIAPPPGTSISLADAGIKGVVLGRYSKVSKCLIKILNCRIACQLMLSVCYIISTLNFTSFSGAGCARGLCL